MAGRRLGVWWCGPGGMPTPEVVTGEAGTQREQWAGLLELADTLVPAPAVPPAADPALRGLSALRRHLRVLGRESRCPRAVVLLGGAQPCRVLRAASGGCAARLLGRAPGAASDCFRLAWAALQEGHPVAWLGAPSLDSAGPLGELGTELGVPLLLLREQQTLCGWTVRLLDAAARAGWGGVQPWLGAAPPDTSRLPALASALRPARLH